MATYLIKDEGVEKLNLQSIEKSREHTKKYKTSKEKSVFSESIKNLALKHALDLVKNKGYNLTNAAATCRIPRATLERKFLSGEDSMKKRGPPTFMNQNHEEQFADFLLNCIRRGFSPSVHSVLEQANLILRTFYPGRKTQPLGRTWLKLFVKRHPVLQVKKCKFISKARARVSQASLRQWFSTVDLYFLSDIKLDIKQIEPERIVNADEFCLTFNPKHEKFVLGEANSTARVQHTGPEKQGISILFSVTADGSYTKPLILFEYKKSIPQTVIQNLDTSFFDFHMAPAGMMRNGIFMYYIEFCLVPHMKKLKVQFPILLYIDNHSAHYNLKISKLCLRLGVILIALYPNSTGVLQPCDVSIFGPLEAAFDREVSKERAKRPYFYLNNSNFSNLFKEAIKTSVTKQLVKKGFRDTGLFPFNPDMVELMDLQANESNKNIKRFSDYEVPTTDNEILIESREDSDSSHVSDTDTGFIDQFSSPENSPPNSNSEIPLCKETNTDQTNDLSDTGFIDQFSSPENSPPNSNSEIPLCKETNTDQTNDLSDKAPDDQFDFNQSNPKSTEDEILLLSDSTLNKIKSNVKMELYEDFKQTMKMSAGGKEMLSGLETNTFVPTNLVEYTIEKIFKLIKPPESVQDILVPPIPNSRTTNRSSYIYPIISSHQFQEDMEKKEKEYQEKRDGIENRKKEREHKKRSLEMEKEKKKKERLEMKLEKSKEMERKKQLSLERKQNKITNRIHTTDNKDLAKKSTENPKNVKNATETQSKPETRIINNNTKRSRKVMDSNQLNQINENELFEKFVKLRNKNSKLFDENIEPPPPFMTCSHLSEEDINMYLSNYHHELQKIIDNYKKTKNLMYNKKYCHVTIVNNGVLNETQNLKIIESVEAQYFTVEDRGMHTNFLTDIVLPEFTIYLFENHFKWNREDTVNQISNQKPTEEEPPKKRRRTKKK